MAVTLQTELGSLMFSSQIPDIVITTSDDNEVEMCLDCRDHTIFSALHFPYGRSVKIHDLRSVIEYYLRDRNTSLDEFQLRSVTNGTQQILATFQVLYLEQHFTGDIEEFLRNNFLTTMAAKLTSPKATEFLHFFIEANAQEYITYQVVASVYGGEPRIYQMRENCGLYNHDRIKSVELTCEMLIGIVESPADGRPMPGNVPSHSMCRITSRRSRSISAMPSTSMSVATCKQSPRTRRSLTAQSPSPIGFRRSTTSRTRSSTRSRPLGLPWSKPGGLSSCSTPTMCAWRPGALTSRRMISGTTIRSTCRLSSSPTSPAKSTTRTVSSTPLSSPTSTKTGAPIFLLITSRSTTTEYSPLLSTPPITDMAQSIHISTLRKMLKAGDPVDIKLWTKSGEIQEWRNCIPLRYDFYKGTQRFKLLNSGQIRLARICCIFSVNNLEIFL